MLEKKAPRSGDRCGDSGHLRSSAMMDGWVLLAGLLPKKEGVHERDKANGGVVRLESQHQTDIVTFFSAYRTSILNLSNESLHIKNVQQSKRRAERTEISSSASSSIEMALQRWLKGLLYCALLQLRRLLLRSTRLDVRIFSHGVACLENAFMKLDMGNLSRSHRILKNALERCWKRNNILGNRYPCNHIQNAPDLLTQVELVHQC